MQQLTVPMDVPPYRLSGAVYGALLNHNTALAALGDAVKQPPYQSAPRSPVLFIKPRNTLILSGERVQIPREVEELEIGACLGLVIGRPACGVAEEQALDFVAGYLIVNDLSVPHHSYYRPCVSCRARDGFCPIGPRVVARAASIDPDALAVRVYVDGQLRHESSTSQLLRPVRRLLADVTEFMTLSAGDVLAVGAAVPAPRVRAGQRACVEIDGLGRLESEFVAGAA